MPSLLRAFSRRTLRESQIVRSAIIFGCGTSTDRLVDPVPHLVNWDKVIAGINFHKLNILTVLYNSPIFSPCIFLYSPDLSDIVKSPTTEVCALLCCDASNITVYYNTENLVKIQVTQVTEG